MSLKGKVFYALVVGGFLACAKVSDFGQPYMQEVFMGSLSITPGVSGLDPGGDPSSVVTLVGNGSGTTVSIHGLPKNDPFTLLPKKDPFSIETPPTVSGLEAE